MVANHIPGTWSNQTMTTPGDTRVDTRLANQHVGRPNHNSAFAMQTKQMQGGWSNQTRGTSDYNNIDKVSGMRQI